MDTVAQSSYAPDARTTRPLWRRVLGWPCTALGRWSLLLLAGFVALMVLFFALISVYGGGDEVRRLSMQAGGRFFSLPWLGSTLLAAALSAIAGGVVALAAIIRKGERSIVMLVPLFVAGFVLFWPSVNCWKAESQQDGRCFSGDPRGNGRVAALHGVLRVCPVPIPRTRNVVAGRRRRSSVIKRSEGTAHVFDSSTRSHRTDYVRLGRLLHKEDGREQTGECPGFHRNHFRG